jgi:glycine oxidase
MTNGNSDVLIVGGGVIGLSIARELHRRGMRSISILDAGSCGREASWAAAGMLGPQAESDEADLFFHFCTESRDLYPALSDELLDETGIDIELDRAGTLSIAFSNEDSAKLQERYHWQKGAGLDVEILSATDIRRAEPFISTDVREGLYFPGDWQVDNRKLCNALRKYCEKNGVSLIENLRVSRIITERDRVTGVEAGGVHYRADEVILAAGAWTSQLIPSEANVRVNIEPVRGQMIALQTAKRLFEHVVHSSNGYIVPRNSGRILAGSTTEKVGFDNSTTEAVSSQLFDMACGISPSFVNLETADHWSGLRPRTADGLPVIGRIQALDGLFLATGHYRNGILLAPATAHIVASDLLEGERSAYNSAFNPERFSLKAVTSGN